MAEKFPVESCDNPLRFSFFKFILINNFLVHYFWDIVHKWVKIGTLLGHLHVTFKITINKSPRIMRQIHMIIREGTKMNELPKEIPISTEESNLGNRQLEREREKRMSVLNCLLEHLIELFMIYSGNDCEPEN